MHGVVSVVFTPKCVHTRRAVTHCSQDNHWRLCVLLGAQPRDSYHSPHPRNTRMHLLCCYVQFNTPTQYAEKQLAHLPSLPLK